MNEICRNIGCNDNENGRCMTIACGGSDLKGDKSIKELLFSLSRFRSVLVKHNIILPESIDDAEGFDGERTLESTRLAYEELMDV